MCAQRVGEEMPTGERQEAPQVRESSVNSEGLRLE